ncbi:MAG: lytic transglycosylase domain-containing protein, partial [Acidobacteria bacterium]|nr:lytic transglycosylase domain-containing protein [Acidobacteriota bacterium]
AEQHRVDPELIRAVVQVESNFDPRAVSPMGAMGLMQLIPDTAKRFGVHNIFDPRANLDGGIRYLKYLMDLFNGDLRLALAAYNAGENAVSRSGGIPAFSETRNYLRKISLLYPLDRPRQAAFAIEKFVDSKGVVHFSNTELP